MKKLISLTCLMCVSLVGCSSGGSPTPISYKINLSLANSSSLNSTLAYDHAIKATYTISGGSITDVNYPKQIQMIGDNITVADPNHCLNSSTAHQTCTFDIYNSYAGPNATTPITQTIRLKSSSSTTVDSNQSSIVLDGLKSTCSNAICLTDITPIDRFSKLGNLHDNLEYQFKLDIGNPAKLLAPTTTTLVDPNITNGDNIAILDKTCSTNNLSCTFTVQNQNMTTKIVDQAISASSYLQNSQLQTLATSNQINVSLSAMQSCAVDPSKPTIKDGILLNTGKLPVYENGAFLTSDQYTSSAMSAMYPINLSNGTPNHDTYTIQDHLIAINTYPQIPYLFSDQANDNIPASKSATSGYLDHHTCAEALAAYKAKQPKGTFVAPWALTVADKSVVQQCYDDKQIRFVHYAIPQGTPPSKNGWPVIIMLHGSAGQSSIDLNPKSKNYKTSAYYFTYQDKTATTPVRIFGSVNDQVFSNKWNWSAQETGDQSVLKYDYSYYVRMRLIQTWLSRGYAVIVPSTWNAGAYDWWSFEPSYKQPWPFTQSTWPKPVSGQENNIISYFDEAYWPGMDKQFFVALITKMMDPQGFDPTNKSQSTKLDMHNVFLFGYSAGANMVSRLVNEFPSMTLNDSAKTPFPSVKAAIILSGGSYSCYLKNGDVCPADALEERYNSNSAVVNHPPTLVAQSLYDDNAGPTGNYNQLAGSVYYQSYLDFCPTTNKKCQPENGGTNGGFGAIYQPDNLIQMIHTANKNIHHYFFPEMVIPSLNLMLKNTCVAKVASHQG